MMKIAVLSSLAQETGCWLRAQYIANSLRNADKKARIDIIKPVKRNLPFMLDLLISIPLNLFRVLFSKADIFIAVKPFPNVTIPLLAKKIISRSRIVIDIDDLDSGYRKGALSKINSAVQKPFPRYFDIVTYHNPLLYDYIQKEFCVKKERLYKLEQGVDLSLFDYKTDKKLKERFAGNGEKIILFVGHLNVASDLDDILRAMKIAQDELTRLKERFVFIIAGGGPEEENLKKLARLLKVKAVFTGYLDKEEIAKYISAADLCLVYYKDKHANYYRCSMKMRECMAMGKKIACDDVGELKKFREYSYQSPADIKKYAEKIVEIIKSGGDGRERKGRKFIEKNFDWEEIGRRFMKRLKILPRTSQ